MTQVLELAHRDFKAATLTMVKEVRTHMLHFSKKNILPKPQKTKSPETIFFKKENQT